MLSISTARFKSLEFWLAVLTAGGAWLAQLADSQRVSAHDAILATAFSAGFYALARGLAKHNADGKPWLFTSEFWGSVIGAATVVVGKLDGSISANLMQELILGLSALTMISNALRTPPAQAVENGVPARAPGDGVLGD